MNLHQMTSGLHYKMYMYHITLPPFIFLGATLDGLYEACGCGLEVVPHARTCYSLQAPHTRYAHFFAIFAILEYISRCTLAIRRSLGGIH